MRCTWYCIIRAAVSVHEKIRGPQSHSSRDRQIYKHRPNHPSLLPDTLPGESNARLACRAILPLVHFFVISTFADLARFHCETKFLITISPSAAVQNVPNTWLRRRDSFRRPSSSCNWRRDLSFTQFSPRRDGGKGRHLPFDEKQQSRRRFQRKGPQEAGVSVLVSPSASWTCWTFLNARQVRRGLLDLCRAISTDTRSQRQFSAKDRCDLYRERAWSTI